MLGCCPGDVDKSTPNLAMYSYFSHKSHNTHTHTNAELVAADGAGDGGEDMEGLVVGTVVGGTTACRDTCLW